jgi:hypothetical protein
MKILIEVTSHLNKISEEDLSKEVVSFIKRLGFDATIKKMSIEVSEKC